MPFPDDPDDDAGFIPPLPQDDRLWRHPSEVDGPHSLASARNRRSSRSGLTAFILLLVIAIGTGIAAFGTFHSSGATHDDRDEKEADAAHARTPRSFTSVMCCAERAHWEPPSKNSFFQIGTDSFSVSIANSHASNAAPR